MDGLVIPQSSLHLVSVSRNQVRGSIVNHLDGISKCRQPVFNVELVLMHTCNVVSVDFGFQLLLELSQHFADDSFSMDSVHFSNFSVLAPENCRITIL